MSNCCSRMVPFPADTPYDSALIAELYQALRLQWLFRVGAGGCQPQYCQC